MRVDPTSAVSPERIELGLEQAIAGEGTFLADSPLSPLRYRNINWVNQIRLRYDALTYQWQTWIVGFDRDEQFELLQGLLGDFSARKFAVILIGSWLLVMIPVALTLLYGRKTRRVSELDKLYLKFCGRLASLGVSRNAGEAPQPYAERAAAQLPAVSGQIMDVTAAYSAIAYAGESADANELRRLGRLVRRIK